MTPADVLIPPCPFASVHWFRLAGNSPVLDVHSNYVKQSHRNRFDIAGVNGRVSLTIPVEGQKGQKVPLREIRIVQGSWVRQHLGAIRSGYGRAAFFEYYIDDLCAIYERKHQYLVDFSLDTLSWYLRTGIILDYRISQLPATLEFNAISLQLEPSFTPPPSVPYPQVFSDRHGFTDGLSVLDVIMNKGPETASYLRSL
jgi:hypothetical protein